MSTLNIQQKKAVEGPDGPVLVLAGAGTGKTRVLIERITYLVQKKNILPQNILAVTFTNKAAQEMIHRLEGQAPPWTGTFHSICHRMLRIHGEYVNLQRDFTIVDASDQKKIVRRLCKDMDIKTHTPDQATYAIQRLKDQGEQGLEQHPLAPLYHEYQAYLKESNLVDFGDLLLYAVNVLKHNPMVLDHYQNRWQYVLVDEFQDTNNQQAEWLNLLVQHHKNIFCVGDDDQAIYSWRGASVNHMLDFQRQFPDATLIHLDTNYRCTPNILHTAYSLIAHNLHRYAKNIQAHHTTGDPVLVQGLRNDDEEALWVVQSLKALQKSKPQHTIAILVRAGFQTRLFEEALVSHHMAYTIVGGARFYERKEVKDLIHYLKLIHAPHNNWAFEAVINTPKRGVGAATLARIHKEAHLTNQSLFTTLGLLLEQGTLRQSGTLRTFYQCIEKWHHHKTHQSPEDILSALLAEINYAAVWDQDPQRESRLENITELQRVISTFSSLEAFFDHTSFVTDQGSDQSNALILMTLHAAKGLEFDCVVLAGWEEGIFPHARALESQNLAALEEERRLAYVGLTRAKHQAVITFAWSRRLPGKGWIPCQPSRFLKELSQEFVRFRMNASRPLSSGKGI